MTALVTPVRTMEPALILSKDTIVAAHQGSLGHTVKQVC